MRNYIYMHPDNVITGSVHKLNIYNPFFYFCCHLAAAPPPLVYMLQTGLEVSADLSSLFLQGAIVSAGWLKLICQPSLFPPRSYGCALWLQSGSHFSVNLINSQHWLLTRMVYWGIQNGGRWLHAIGQSVLSNQSSNNNSPRLNSVKHNLYQIVHISLWKISLISSILWRCQPNILVFLTPWVRSDSYSRSLRDATGPVDVYSRIPTSMQLMCIAA